MVRAYSRQPFECLRKLTEYLPIQGRKIQKVWERLPFERIQRQFPGELANSGADVQPELYSRETQKVTMAKSTASSQPESQKLIFHRSTSVRPRPRLVKRIGVLTEWSRGVAISSQPSR